MKGKNFNFVFMLMGILLITCGFTNTPLNEEYYNKNDAGSFDLYFKDSKGSYQLYQTLYFDKNISTKKVLLNEKVYGLKLVKKSGYEVNLDQVTIAGKTDAEYERKLSKKDNDVIELTDTLEINISGEGELVISARAPKTLNGPEYAFKFPYKSEKKEYLTYTLNDNVGTFNSDELEVPSSKYLFYKRDLIHPSSGHPDAPINYYVANDDKYLYIFNEAFFDNTFDHGKDYSKVYIQTSQGTKAYQVNTVENNQYGNWWFTYTDSSSTYNWEHMSYLIKVPLSDLGNDKQLKLQFEYYGTASGPDMAPIQFVLSFSKIDEKNQPLKGAKFQFEGFGEFLRDLEHRGDVNLPQPVALDDNNSEDIDPFVTCSTDDENGNVKFVISTDLEDYDTFIGLYYCREHEDACGESEEILKNIYGALDEYQFRLTELEAPKGYEKLEPLDVQLHYDGYDLLTTNEDYQYQPVIYYSIQSNGENLVLQNKPLAIETPNTIDRVTTTFGLFIMSLLSFISILYLRKRVINN